MSQTLDPRMAPILVAAGAILTANISSFTLSWVYVNQDMNMGSYVLQVGQSISLLQCTDITGGCTATDSCWSNYNNGNLFDFYYIFPLFPFYNASDSSGLFPFLIASYSSLILLSISSYLCVWTLATYFLSETWCTSLSYSFKDRRYPLRIAIILNTVVLAVYFLTTMLYLNGGYYSFGLWVIAYATSIAGIAYYIAIFLEPVPAQLNQYPSNVVRYLSPPNVSEHQELTYLYRQQLPAGENSSETDRLQPRHEGESQDKSAFDFWSLARPWLNLCVSILEFLSFYWQCIGIYFDCFLRRSFHGNITRWVATATASARTSTNSTTIVDSSTSKSTSYTCIVTAPKSKCCTTK